MRKKVTCLGTYSILLKSQNIESLQEITKDEKLALIPESGFNLVGIDPFGPHGNRLYMIEHFEFYQDALKSKNQRKNPGEYLILYPGAD